MNEDGLRRRESLELIRCVRDVRIGMRDGTSLGANVYLPEGEGPWPSIVCCYPYLKDLWMGPLIDNQLRYFASQGFVTVIADMRGTGSSEGSKSDAFEAVEITDMYDLVEGVAELPWSTGDVGCWGLSYGGIMAFRAGTTRPPHLRAIVVVEGSTDPYTAEVMRFGAPGLAMICGEWSTWMLALNALPPVTGSPAEQGKIWQQHLEALHPWHFAWREHPLRDGYWEGRAVDAGDIEVPTLIFTSWRDTNPWIWRDYARIPGYKRIVCGPWQHGFPDEDPRAPIFSFELMADWWKRWLAGDDAVPELPPVSLIDLATDEWTAVEAWPVPTETLSLSCSPSGGLSADPVNDSAELLLPHTLSVGTCNGLGMASPPGDVSADEELSLTFTTEPLQAALRICGHVETTLALITAEERGDVAVRVSAVSPEGESTLVAKGFVRLSNPTEDCLVSREGTSTTVTLRLIPTMFTVPVGNRIRFAVSRSDFPEIWPDATAAPAPAIAVGAETQTTLHLPVMPEGSGVALDLPQPTWVPLTDAAESVTPSLTIEREHGITRIEAGFDARFSTLDRHVIGCRHGFVIDRMEEEPAGTLLSSLTQFTLEQGHRSVAVTATSSSSELTASAVVRISVDDQEVFMRVFDSSSMGETR